MPVVLTLDPLQTSIFNVKIGSKNIFYWTSSTESSGGNYPTFVIIGKLVIELKYSYQCITQQKRIL